MKNVIFEEYIEKYKNLENSMHLQYVLDFACFHRSQVPIGVIQLDSNDSAVIKVPVRAEGPNGYHTVVSVKEKAFTNHQEITDVILPEGIFSIGPEAFFGCRNLENIVIPRNTEYIHWNAFSGCTKLKNIYYEGTEKEWRGITATHGTNEEYFYPLTAEHLVDNMLTEREENGNPDVDSINIYFECAITKLEIPCPAVIEKEIARKRSRESCI